jgi:hypothetical protein
MNYTAEKALKLFGYTIEGTGDLRQVHLADVQINGCGLGRPVTEEQLNVMQARPRLYQMSGKGMSERMRAHRFCYAGALLGLNEYIPYRGITDIGAFLLSFE